MWVVTDKFIEEIENKKSYIPKQILIDSQKQKKLNLLVISDLHYDIPDLKLPDEVTASRNLLTESIKNCIPREKASKEILSNEYDALVICGDLCDAKRVFDKAKRFRDDKEIESFYKEFYEKILVGALDDLCSHLNISSENQLLSIPGNHDIYRSGKTFRELIINSEEKGSFLRNHFYHNFFERRMCQNINDENETLLDIASYPRLLLLKLSDNGKQTRNYGYLALIGIDSNHGEYKHRFIEDHGYVTKKQMDQLQKLTQCLSKTYTDAPLNVVVSTHHHLLPIEKGAINILEDHETSVFLEGNDKCHVHLKGKERQEQMWPNCLANHMVARTNIGVTIDAQQFIESLQNMRVSLVLHGHMHKEAVQEIAYVHLKDKFSSHKLSIVACPSIDVHNSEKGGVVELSCDFESSDVQLDIKLHNKPSIRMTRPWSSSSRISASESKLYSEVTKWISHFTPKHGIEGYQGYVNEFMTKYGYVPVCGQNRGNSIPELQGIPQKSYNLLLLLHKTQNNYYILMNNHYPLRHSRIANWGTLLIPAFNSFSDFIHNLRADLIRQYSEQPVTTIQSNNLQSSISTLNQILEKEVASIEKLDSRLYSLDTKEFIKFSPTEGTPIRYQYNIVTFEPFSIQGKIDRSYTEIGMDPKEHNKLIQILMNLPRIRHPDALIEESLIPFEAVEPKGGGIRWNPENWTIDGVNENAIPHGAVWFPFKQKDEIIKKGEKNFWKRSPSIVARNADVMNWIEKLLCEDLSLITKGEDVYPNNVELGKSLYSSSWEMQSLNLQEDVHIFPFESCSNTEKCGEASSVSEALRHVTYLKDISLDVGDIALGGKLAYPSDLKIRRVVLQRVKDDSGRDIIQVFNACVKNNSVERKEVIGVLRPVQRYVLTSGLNRAKNLYDIIFKKLKSSDNQHDPWSYIKTLKKAGKQIAITPPILEEVSCNEKETNDSNSREFILVDGNHRVVQIVWRSKQILQAIAILGEPKEPFYARPFSKYEWDITSDNELFIAPETNSKYSVRKIDENIKKKLIETCPENKMFRRYYRDLTAGFGYMGGQGGRAG